MTHSYPYRPLVGSSVRLIRILEDEPSESLIRCKLIHMPLDVSPPPQYIAISYTWGDSKSHHKIIELDGHEIHISENLWHALRSIREWEAIEATRGYGPWRYEDSILITRRPWLLWADAVCINQGDADEKSREIPKMKKIFNSAKEVLGWLGHLPPRGVDPYMVDTVLEKARDIQKRARANETDWINLWMGTEANLHAGIGEEDMKSFTETVFAIAQLPWFKRLWIIQEYTVAQISVVMALGPHIFDAGDFHDLLTLFNMRSKWFLQPVDLACPLAMGRIKDRHKLHIGDRVPHELFSMPESDNELDAFAQRLQELLAMASSAPFQSTKKHDMIYGVLSMAGPPDSMPPQLVPDYNLPWVEVCRRYAKFIAERTGAISFLTRIRPAWDNEEIPSWIPDFSASSIIISMLSTKYIEKDRFQGSKVTFSEDGRGMTVDGFSLGMPIALTRRRDLVSKVQDLYHQDREFPFDRVDAREFLDEILQPAAERQGRCLDDVLASWIGIWELCVDRQIVESEMPVIKKTFKHWIKGDGPDKLDLQKPKIAGRLFSERGLAVWRRLKNKSILKNWIVTSDGRGWMTLFLDEIRPDDVVMALRGLEENPALLRKAQQDGCFKLVGLLIERVPLAEVAWEKVWKEALEKGDFSWTKVTLV
jgi:Heterokaryon incompatibility protein (HET)